MGHGLVTEPAAHAFVRMGEFVVIEVGGHQALLGKRESNTRRVACDPATAPLLGNIGGSPRTTRGIKDEVAGVGRHQHSTLDYLGNGLHNIDFVSHETSTHVVPFVVNWEYGKIFQVADVPDTIRRRFESSGEN